MSGLSSRIGKHALKLRTHASRDISRHASNIQTAISTCNKTAMRSVGVGIVMLPPITAYWMYENHQNTTMQFGDYDKPYTYIVKGKANVSDVKVNIGPDKTTIAYKTDLFGGRKFKNTVNIKNDEYQFIPKYRKNPEVIYLKGDNLSVISIGLSKIQDCSETAT